MHYVSNSDSSAQQLTRSQLKQEQGRSVSVRKQRQRRRLFPLIALLLTVAALGWYLTKPSTTSTTSPTTTTSPATTTTTTVPYLPPSVKPTITPATANEGVWTAQDTWLPGAPRVMTTSWRPEASNPNVVAYASWMRSSSSLLALYPGYEGPGPSTLSRGPEAVPPSARPALIATFNSGFYEKDSAAGFYTNGTLYYPMVNGLATVVEYTNGTVDIIDWQGGATPGPTIMMARQNLSLLVNNAQATPQVGNGPAFGVTLHGFPAVWRTALGIDAHGNLIYVAAPEQTAASLAQILLQLGCVRAMQLDINPEWPIYNTYGGPGAANPTLKVPNPNQVPWRFLNSSTKDFFALYAHVPGNVQTPW